MRLAAPGNPWIVAIVLLTSPLIYVSGRAYNFLTLETTAVYGAGVAHELVPRRHVTFRDADTFASIVPPTGAAPSGRPGQKTLPGQFKLSMAAIEQFVSMQMAKSQSSRKFLK